jgi:hypothetical protein
MAEYINIRGQNIEVVASDPANPTVGQIWYNSTSNTLKGQSVTTTPSWATGDNLITGGDFQGGAGTQTAALTIKRSTSIPSQKYDGTSWTAAAATNTNAGGTVGFGIQTAAIGAGGYISPEVTNTTEEYDGSTWSSGSTLATAASSMGAAGTTSAGLVFGGEGTGLGIPRRNTAQEYNGATWSNVNSMPYSATYVTGTGTQTAGLAFGGNNPVGALLTTTVEYDGTNWTSGGALPAGRGAQGASGSQTAGLGFGGYPGTTNTAQLYDGTNWTSTATMSTPRGGVGGLGGTGSQLTALAYGGGSPNTATEEFNGPGLPQTKTITAS